MRTPTITGLKLAQMVGILRRQEVPEDLIGAIVKSFECLDRCLVRLEQQEEMIRGIIKNLEQNFGIKIVDDEASGEDVVTHVQTY